MTTKQLHKKSSVQTGKFNAVLTFRALPEPRTGLPVLYDHRTLVQNRTAALTYEMARV